VTATYEDPSASASHGVSRPGSSVATGAAGLEESTADPDHKKGAAAGAGLAGGAAKKRMALKPGHARDGVLIVERGKALEDEYMLGQRTWSRPVVSAWLVGATQF
jgi:hypothetical protein